MEPLYRSLGFLLISGLCLAAAELPVVSKVEAQPLAANAKRIIQALEVLGEPLIARSDIERLARSSETGEIQNILDKYCLVGVHINPEARVKVEEGPAKPELIQQGWRTFLVKVRNEAGTTAVLDVSSPNAGQVANRPEGTASRRFLDIQLHRKQPMATHLSGLEVEYAILQIFSRDAGKREAKLIFDIGQGSQDLGFRSEIDLLFTSQPATKLNLRVLDSDGSPTTAAFLIKDRHGRVYPSQAKRLAPDFFFQQQIYREDGEAVLLPEGEYTIEYQRGPEYRRKIETIKVAGAQMEHAFRLERWIDPAKLGWFSGDHHVHAAGCSHYQKPTEGVYPQDMMRHILGEDLKVGSVLTWGPGWYFQKSFFEGKDNKLSKRWNLMRYDVEVSGFPSSHTGHLVLLGLKEQDYPNTKRIEDWPSWGVPVLKWAKSQGAIVGYAHSGWGLAIKEAKLPSFEMPPFDGIGANEFIVSVAHGLPDFISAIDTPYPWELNIWYHTLSAGYRTRISGETDFPCIYDQRVGLGRSYVKQTTLNFRDWIDGVKAGRVYVSDGKSHIFDFAVNGVEMGGKDVRVTRSGAVKVTARVAALLDAEPDDSIRKRPLDQKPYWHIERARIGTSRRVPIELVVNGIAVARQEIEADGEIRPVEFSHNVDRSSWVALRVLPSSHTNPVFVLVDGKPIREKASIEWCLRAVDECWRQKGPRIREGERVDAERAYNFARSAYQTRLKDVAK